MSKGFVTASKKFLKKNGSTILTCAGALGVIGTAITAVSATPKAIRLLNEAKERKGDKLTVIETVKTAGPVYLPAAAIGASTIACIFGANVLNHKAQASMASAYALADQSYKEYTAKVKELYGDDTDQKIRDAIMRDKVECSSPWISPCNGLEEIAKASDKVLFYDEYSNRYFESTFLEVQGAEYHLNRNFALAGYCELNEFYELLGLDRVPYGDVAGWSVECGYCFIDFNHRKVKLEENNPNGLECYVIDYVFPPNEDFMNPHWNYCGE